MGRILVVDDEPEIGQFVRRALEADGHQVVTATDGAEGLRRALTERPDLVVLDLLMPGVDGLAVLSGILAQDPRCRILVLSAAAEVTARIDCLERGAVDFLAKPFAVRELTARVRSRLGEQRGAAAREMLRVGGLVLDVHRRELQVNGRLLTLSPREFALLAHLMRKANDVCSREELLLEVWGYAFDPGTNIVDVYVRRLRAKLRDDVIHTVRNVGYQLQSA